MSRRLTTEEFTSRSSTIHNNKYDYSEVNYIRSKDKIKIRCPVHGIFEQRASNHLLGLGCYKCSERSNIGMFKPWCDRLEEIKRTHGDKYEYFNTENIGIFDFIKIRCHKHGVFKQRLHDHIGGSGCRACGGGSNYRKSKYIEKCNRNHNGLSNFYILKIKENNGTVFYKAGITVQDIRQRYSKSVMPYEYEVVKNIKANASDVFDLEIKIKSLLSKCRHKPEIVFAGSRYECFSHIPDKVLYMIDSLVDNSE